MDPQRRVLTNTDLLIEDSVIASFGKGLKEKADRVIDGRYQTNNGFSSNS